MEGPTDSLISPYPSTVPRSTDSAGNAACPRATLTTELVSLGARLAAAFDRLRSVGELAEIPSSFRTRHQLLNSLAHKLPSVGDDRSYAKAGGLISRSVNYLAIAPRAARFVDQILNGVGPGDLAVELAEDYEIIVNLKTARELGVTIPPAVLMQATEVIE